MKQSSDNRSVSTDPKEKTNSYQLSDGVYCYTNQIANVAFIGSDPENWIMVDAGMPGSAKELKEAAEQRYGKGSRPRAILLTHGHFDHVGGIVDLIREWHVPVFAHGLEFPYLTGFAEYPDHDATGEDGMPAKLSSIYPHEAIDICEALYSLPLNGNAPMLPGWKWIHTPGHSPGHVSFFRAKDKTLIAGDAFVTQRTDPFYKTLHQKEEVNGPPSYLTTNWDDAYDSVVKLALLEPEHAITGHGKAMHGEVLRNGLKKLVEEFDQTALPGNGKYSG